VGSVSLLVETDIFVHFHPQQGEIERLPSEPELPSSCSALALFPAWEETVSVPLEASWKGFAAI